VLEGCRKVVESVGNVIITLSQAQYFKKSRFELRWLAHGDLKNKGFEHGLHASTKGVEDLNGVGEKGP